jgi:2-oxo-4-hydroxy-4-carboxy-5-ureidoimidazoline decarboxylase
MTLAEINAMPADRFVAKLGDVAEHSPWVAEAAAKARPFLSREALIDAFAQAVLNAPPDRQVALLCAHPDLARKAAVSGELTRSSREEQSRAGLDTLTEEEFARFNSLNETYRRQFGFPFIFAVKGATKHQILAAFGERLENSRDTELRNALAEVNRIVRFRLEDRVAV